jgi:hypothetical protein
MGAAAVPSTASPVSTSQACPPKSGERDSPDFLAHAAKARWSPHQILEQAVTTALGLTRWRFISWQASPARSRWLSLMRVATGLRARGSTPAMTP